MQRLEVSVAVRPLLWSLGVKGLRDNVEIYSRARQTVHDDIIQGMRVACWVTNATNTHTMNTYLLTPRCRVLLEKPTGLQPVKKFPAFHGTRRFITALTSVRHLSLSWASPIQSIYPHPTDPS